MYGKKQDKREGRRREGLGLSAAVIHRLCRPPPSSFAVTSFLWFLVRRHLLTLFLPSISCSPRCSWRPQHVRRRLETWDGHTGVDRREVEKRKEGRCGSGFVIVLATVALGEMPNPNLLLWIKFCGSNHWIRRGSVGVIPEILEINFRPCSEFLSDRAVSVHSHFRSF